MLGLYNNPETGTSKHRKSLLFQQLRLEARVGIADPRLAQNRALAGMFL